ncbi:hypothetical protein [Bradyrhizobium sp. LMTR 3]|nr:hypothetical protein [Bradyrhizobium sp. LMTR 3]
MNVASSFTYLPESNVNAMIAGHATIMRAAARVSGILVFSLNV